MAAAEQLAPEPRQSVVSGYEGDALVEVAMGLVLGDEHPEQAPWCVDFEGRIRCMSACEVLRRLATGQLMPSTMIWRDGYGTWLAIADCSELESAARGELLSDLDIDVDEPVEESRVRLRRDVVMRDMASYRRKRSLRSLRRLPWRFLAVTMLVAASVFCLCYFPFSAQGKHAAQTDGAALHQQSGGLRPWIPSLLADLNERKARLLEAQWQREKSWWLKRWPEKGR